MVEEVKSSTMFKAFNANNVFVGSGELKNPHGHTEIIHFKNAYYKYFSCGVDDNVFYEYFGEITVTEVAESQVTMS